MKPQKSNYSNISSDSESVKKYGNLNTFSDISSYSENVSSESENSRLDCDNFSVSSSGETEITISSNSSTRSYLQKDEIQNDDELINKILTYENNYNESSDNENHETTFSIPSISSDILDKKIDEYNKDSIFYNGKILANSNNNDYIWIRDESNDSFTGSSGITIIYSEETLNNQNTVFENLAVDTPNNNKVSSNESNNLEVTIASAEIKRTNDSFKKSLQLMNQENEKSRNKIYEKVINWLPNNNKSIKENTPSLSTERDNPVVFNPKPIVSKKVSTKLLPTILSDAVVKSALDIDNEVKEQNEIYIKHRKGSVYRQYAKRKILDGFEESEDFKKAKIYFDSPAEVISSLGITKHNMWNDKNKTNLVKTNIGKNNRDKLLEGLKSKILEKKDESQISEIITEETDQDNVETTSESSVESVVQDKPFEIAKNYLSKNILNFDWVNLFQQIKNQPTDTSNLDFISNDHPEKESTLSNEEHYKELRLILEEYGVPTETLDNQILNHEETKI